MTSGSRNFKRLLDIFLSFYIAEVEFSTIQM